MSNTIADQEARAIAEDVAAQERARATLREAGNWSPVGVGLIGGFVICGAFYSLFAAEATDLWIQISMAVAGVGALAGQVFYWRKYRKLVRAIEVVLAQREP